MTPLERKKISVGVRYECERYPGEFFTIIHRDGDDGFDRLNYVGLSDGGDLVLFDQFGVDKWYECGGSWNRLNVDVEHEPMWELKHLPTENLRKSL